MISKVRNEKGITLIALVVTIIVLLILAQVTFNLISTRDGVIDKTIIAVEGNDEETLREEVKLVLTEWRMDYVVDKIPYDGRTAKTASGADMTYLDNKVIVTRKDGTVYIIPFVNGNMGDFIEIEKDKESQVYKAMNPRVPNGYTHIAGEWNTGYIIRENSTNDEFVWIPVISEESYVKKSGSYNFSIEAGSSGKDYEIDIENDILGDEIGLTDILGIKVTGTLSKTAPEAEVVNNAGGFYVSRYEIGIANAEREANPTLINTSNISTVEIKSQAGLEPLRRITQEAALELSNNWKTGTDVQSGLITGTEWDVMCDFIGWTTCNSDCSTWGNFVNVKSKSYTEGEVWHSGILNSEINGTANGYHWNNNAIARTVSEDIDGRIIFATGEFINENGGNTAKKNIYDIAGNMWEWTTEVSSFVTDSRVLRGCSVEYNVDVGNATSRIGMATKVNTNWTFGFRCVLYIK